MGQSLLVSQRTLHISLFGLIQQQQEQNLHGEGVNVLQILQKMLFLLWKQSKSNQLFLLGPTTSACYGSAWQ